MKESNLRIKHSTDEEKEAFVDLPDFMLHSKPKTAGSKGQALIDARIVRLQQMHKAHEKRKVYSKVATNHDVTQSHYQEEDDEEV